MSLMNAWNLIRKMWHTGSARPDLDKALEELRSKVPAPVIWLFGKTQSGKTSIIRNLTGAEDAAIGNGFKPCTRTSRIYRFPAEEAPLLSFLDTRGLDEVGYDPREDLETFATQAHIVIVTAKLTDLAQGNIRESLAKIRQADRNRPVLLVLTNLHEAYPGQQHPLPYPYPDGPIPADVIKLIHEHKKQFEGLYDDMVLMDLTKPEEGFTEPQYGLEALKQAILARLPTAYRVSMLRLQESQGLLKEIHQKQAGPILLGYASLAGSAGAIPIPFVDLLILPAIQTRMVYQLAQVYGQELTAARFLELAGSLGMGLLARQAIRETAKLIPFVGSAAGAVIAAASTYALGRAFCMYYEAVHKGHAPDSSTLKRFYQEQFQLAQLKWGEPKTEAPRSK